MRNKLIAFIIQNPSPEDYNHVKRKIDQLCQTWARIGESTYLIKTDMSSVEIRESVEDTIISGRFSKIFVCEWSKPAAWQGLSKGVSDWIQNS